MKVREKIGFGKTEKKLTAMVSERRQKKYGGKNQFVFVVLMMCMCLIGMFGVVLAEGEEPLTEQDVTVQEKVTISDTEQFIRWHSTAFGTDWFHWNASESVIEAEDGSYVVAGWTTPNGDTRYSKHAYMTKFNKDGSIAWDRVYGGGANGLGTAEPYAHYLFLKVIQLANGDFLAVGHTNDTLGMSAKGYESFFVVRIDNNGNTLWQKAYGFKDQTVRCCLRDAVENEDGSISVWGEYIPYWQEVVELKISSDGNLQDEFLFSDDMGKDPIMNSSSIIQKTSDGGFIGYQTIFDGVHWSDSIVKLNDAGIQEWGLRLLPKESSTGYPDSVINGSKIVELSDGYLVAGVTTIKNPDEANAPALIVYRIDLNGNVQWTKIYQNLTLNNRVYSVNVSKTGTDEVLLWVSNGTSVIDYTMLKLDTSDGDVKWVKSYGNKTGFERGYGGNANLQNMLQNSNGQLVGIGNRFITKLAGDGSIAFVTDDFIAQDRTNYSVTDVETTLSHFAILEKVDFQEDIVMQKDISLLTGLSSHDTAVVGEPVTLQSIDITSPATKLIYKVGETLDISGLVLTGTYSDSTTKVETITVDKISGFDSSKAAASQVLTITVNGKTATYTIKITDPAQAGFVAFLGQDPDGYYYEYNAKELSNAYLAYQINPGLASAKMYQQFLDSHCKIVALKDGEKGYMDYNAAASASLLAQIKGEAFDINAYFARADAKLYDQAVENVRIVDKDGNVLIPDGLPKATVNFYPSLIPGTKTVIVNLDTETPLNYMVTYDGTALAYDAIFGGFKADIPTNVSETLKPVITKI